MPIAQYYQSIVDRTNQLSSSRHRASFIGMFNCGNDFVFRQVSSQPENKKVPLIVPVDLNKTAGDMKKICNAFYQSLQKLSSDIKPFFTFEEMWGPLLKITTKRQVTLLLYFGDEAVVEMSLIENIYRWRNYVGDKLNWIVFANYRILHARNATDPLFEKFIKANVIPVLPVDQANAKFVYKSFEGYFGKLDQNRSTNLIQLSGGNPGLLKSLYLLALSGDLDNWHTDTKITMRIIQILEDLTKKELDLLSHSQITKQKDKKTFDDLHRFGYINSRGELFSPLVRDYLPFYFETSHKEMSVTQQKIFTLLKEQSPSAVSRDDIAKKMWGNRFHEEYSEWAIDQMIYAIRTILKKSRSKWQIVTKRNVGYYLRPLAYPHE